MPESILLIDDDPKLLTELADAVRKHLQDREIEVRAWTPSRDERDSHKTFTGMIEQGTLLVVTDYDLTAQGRTGLFGATIVAWCQAKAIAVGDFSRANVSALPSEPNLFEIRVPTATEAAAAFIVAVFKGFHGIRNYLGTHPELLREKRSWAAVLASLLGDPAVEGQLALYGIRLGTNAALMDRLTNSGTEEHGEAEKGTLLTYIVGHILLNAVLRFPGPILSRRALAAYVGTGAEEEATIEGLFQIAAYSGPFAELGPYFWLGKVDSRAEGLMKSLPPDHEYETSGEMRRVAIEQYIGRDLVAHSCPRCQGKNGGFLCPFTERTVCERSDCSVGANSWIPQGAVVCRIERDFYDEWAPILGL